MLLLGGPPCWGPLLRGTHYIEGALAVGGPLYRKNKNSLIQGGIQVTQQKKQKLSGCPQGVSGVVFLSIVFYSNRSYFKCRRLPASTATKQYLSLSPSLSVPLSLYLSISLCLPLSVSLSLSLYLSLCLSLSLCLDLCLCLSLWNVETPGGAKWRHWEVGQHRRVDP